MTMTNEPEIFQLKATKKKKEIQIKQGSMFLTIFEV